MNRQTTVAVAEAGRPAQVGLAREAAAGAEVAEASPEVAEALAEAAAAEAGNMKREFFWIAASITTGILVVAIATSFQFNAIELQLHDTYIILGSAHAIIFVSVSLLTSQYLYRLNLFLIDRSRSFAVILVFVIPVALYFLAIYVYLMASLIHVIANVEGHITLKQSGWPVYIPALIFIMPLIALEVAALIKIARKNR